MSRRKRQPAADPADRGAQPWRVMVVDEPDETSPHTSATILRGRVYDPVRRLERDGEIDRPHFLAAERFRTKYEVAEGARDTSTPGRLEPWQRCHYAAARADARAEVRASLQAVGLRLAAVFVAAVVHYQPMRSIEQDLGMRHGTAKDTLRDALELLARWQAANTA